MAEIWLDVDKALSEVPVNIIPLLDDTDFKTRETAVAYNAAGMDLVWNFVTTAGAYTQTAVIPTTGGNYDWTHQGDGMYSIEIPASGGASINNDTEGFGWFTGYADGVLPWRSPIIGFRSAQLNDALIDGGDLLQVDITQIDGQATSGNNATLNLKQLNIVNNAGSAIIAWATGSNGDGININGNGTGEGIRAIGGVSGDGVVAIGGSTTGVGLRILSPTAASAMLVESANGFSIDATGGVLISANAGQAGMNISSGSSADGISISGNGTGSGIRIVPGATGNGINVIGGATSGAAVRISGTAGNAQGLHVTGQGSAAAIHATGGATGHGVLTQGGATSGNGIYALAQTAGHGARFDGLGAGAGILATGDSLDGIRATSTNANGVFSQGGTNQSGIRAAGNGTGAGVYAVGGASGDGMLLSGAGGYDLNALTIRALEAARTEPASVPVANAGALTKLDWIFTLTRNKRLTTATLDTVRNDADSANIATAVLSDDGTIFTRAEYT